MFDSVAFPYKAWYIAYDKCWTLLKLAPVNTAPATLFAKKLTVLLKFADVKLLLLRLHCVMSTTD